MRHCEKTLSTKDKLGFYTPTVNIPGSTLIHGRLSSHSLTIHILSVILLLSGTILVLTVAAAHCTQHTQITLTGFSGAEKGTYGNECKTSQKISTLTWVSACVNGAWTLKLTWTFCVCTKSKSNHSLYHKEDMTITTHSNTAWSTTKTQQKLSCNEAERVERSQCSTTSLTKPLSETVTVCAVHMMTPRSP